MTQLGLKESDIQEQFITGSGKGGQKQNKTHNCVQLKHIPTGTIVKCQKGRERELNRFLARRQLCETIALKDPSNTSQKEQKRDKQRKQKQRRKRRTRSGQPSTQTDTI